MEGFLETVPGAVTAGMGAVLCALGYKTLRFHSLTMSVHIFGGLGCAAGAVARSPILAALLTAAGALLGCALGPALFRVYVALAALAGGAAVGFLLSIVTAYSNPPLLCASAAVGCAVIALMNARAATIAWTSCSGAAVAAVGVLLAGLGTDRLFRLPSDRSMLERHAWTGLAIFLSLFIAGALFQAVTTREPAPSPQPVTNPS